MRSTTPPPILPPTSGLAGGGGGGALSWTGGLLSLPLAADFGSCPEGAAEGRPYETESLLFIVFGSRPLFQPVDNGEGAYGPRVCNPAPLANEFGPMEAWLEGLLLRLALAGPAGNLKKSSAPSPSRV